MAKAVLIGVVLAEAARRVNTQKLRPALPCVQSLLCRIRRRRNSKWAHRGGDVAISCKR